MAMRTAVIAIGVALLMSGCASKTGVSTFKKAGVFAGSVVTQDACASSTKDGTGVWVDVDGRGEYIRYFAAGLMPDKTAHVLVYLHGDRMREIAVIDAALTAIKVKHRITDVSVAGQSGGGHVVASLLARRTDIVCAVMSSGVVAVAARIKARGWPVDATGCTRYLDPIDHLDAVPKDPRRRIFVVGDERDTTVPFETQQLYFDKMKSLGHDVTLLKMTGKGKSNHALAVPGIVIAGWCASGMSTAKIQENTRDGALPE